MYCGHDKLTDYLQCSHFKTNYAQKNILLPSRSHFNLNILLTTTRLTSFSTNGSLAITVPIHDTFVVIYYCRVWFITVENKGHRGSLNKYFNIIKRKDKCNNELILSQPIVYNVHAK